MLLTAGCDRARSNDNGWDPAKQGQGIPVPEHIVEHLEEHDEERGRIEELEPEFRDTLQQLLDELRRRGWAARVAIGPRTLDEQIDLFEQRRTTLLRGSHLCRRAADLSLYPVGIPAVEHRFWDVKDEVAVGLGLDVVDYEPGKFVDRPHVQSTRCSTADWDRLGLSPVGGWVGELEGDELRLDIGRNDDGLTLAATREGSPVGVDDFHRERGDGEDKLRLDEIRFRLGDEQATGQFSTVKNDSGLVRPDYRSLKLTIAGESVTLERDD